MTIRAFTCGEPLCKTSFEAEIRPEKPWPVKCPGCGRSLYPDAVLRAESLENLDQHRGPLMKVAGGRLVPVTEHDLAPAPPGPMRSLLDEIAEATDVARVEPETRPPVLGEGGRRKSRTALGIIAAIVVLVALAIAWAVLRAH